MLERFRGIVKGLCLLLVVVFIDTSVQASELTQKKLAALESVPVEYRSGGHSQDCSESLHRIGAGSVINIVITDLFGRFLDGPIFFGPPTDNRTDWAKPEIEDHGWNDVDE